MRFWIGVLALACAVAGAARSEAGDGVVLMELFTSQGCASCPPADELLGAYAQREDVIALSMHVDYWDYIGWQDSFGNPVFTARQKKYARNRGRATIYTPQIVVGGVEVAQSVRPSVVHELVSRHLSKPARVLLTLTRSATGKVLIEARAEPPLEQEADVMLIRYLPRASVSVTSGENNGRRLTHYNVVTSMENVGRWNGQGALNLAVSAPGDAPVVVVVQTLGQGPVLAAARRR